MKFKNNITIYNRKKYKIKSIKEIINKITYAKKIISTISQQYNINIEGNIRTV